MIYKNKVQTISMKEKKYYITKIPLLLIIIGIFEIMYIILFLQNIQLAKAGHYTPSYNYVDLKQICSKDSLSEKDYKTLFYQTGLSPHAIDKLRTQPEYFQKIKRYQDIFFRKINISSTATLFLTKTEFIDSITYANEKAFIPAPLENGYILYTPSSSTLGWRNGHIALVVDENKKQIFEAASIGELSEIRNYEHWTSYPAFIMLRIKPELLNINSTLLNEVISTIKNELINLPYSLLCGVTTPKNIPRCTKSHCAHIIWHAFLSQGIDIDSNKGVIVTPENIMKCDLLEVVQIYGVDPSLYINRIAY